MKKIITLLCLLLLSLNGHGQGTGVEIPVMSPETASLGKFGAYPVSYYTGQPDISIPLYRLDVHGLSIPIALRYDPSGFMPNKDSGKVGHDWSLVSPVIYERSYAGDLLLKTRHTRYALFCNKFYAPGLVEESRGSGASCRTRYEYLLNTASAPLSCLQYGTNASYALTGGTSGYAPGQLSVVKRTDEDGNVSYTFTDKLGRTLLERRMKGSEAHDTYYMYNDLGNLCFVLQPMYQTTADLDKYAFRYKFDDYGRCVWKKLPGAGYVEMVYDSAGRLTFSQDGNQRALTTNNWTYYKYDALNRLTERGVCTNKVTTSGTTAHIKNYYDDYGFVGGTGFPTGQFTRETSGYGKGSLTGSEITVFGDSKKIYVAHYYDIRGRVVKTVRSNLSGGYDVTATTYTFTDNPATLTHTHTASGKTTRTEAYAYSYDHADRLSKVEHTLGGTKVTLYECTLRGYKFTYDGLDRLLNATYGETASITANAHRFSENVTAYDKNGNIKSLQRYG